MEAYHNPFERDFCLLKGETVWKKESVLQTHEISELKQKGDLKITPTAAHSVPGRCELSQTSLHFSHIHCFSK